MPYRNGTGPLGQGPMTGRGFGNCALGTGRNFGCGQGFGRGRGWRGFPGYGYQAYPYSQQEEKDVIKEDISAMQEEIKALENRLAELRGSKKQ